MATMTNEAFIAAVLSAGGAAYFRPNNWSLERPEVDAYLELLDLLATFSGVDARIMEVAPGSDERRTVLAGQLAKSGAADNPAVLRKSRQVLRLILEHAPQAIIAAFLSRDAMAAALATPPPSTLQPTAAA